RLAPPRFCELLGERSLRGTLFAVGDDLLARRSAAPPSSDGEDDPEEPLGAPLPGAAPLRAAAEAGHEIGNHTRHHRYDLVRLPEAHIAREVHGGAKAIAAAVGRRPVGFRAPGYTLSPAVLRAAIEAGHRYDSSAYPAAPYYAAKASVLALQRLVGRHSRAILDRPRVLAAPVLPYRPAAAEPYARGDLPLWELPITVEPLSRFPFIGTFVTTMPRSALALLYRSVRRRPFLNLELHGVDLMDRSDGAGAQLPAVQRELRVPAAEKIARLRELLARIADDYEVVTLAQAAERLAAGSLW
ncbi:MAG TPA: polysaccharide deacetylase family protein, partial [Myxococcales bacterium]|nr:polysaccharide deacetylase family protein [Myxococcales bacterium]